MSDDVESLKREAGEAARTGAREAVIAAYRRLLAAAPDLPDYWYDLGYYLRAEGLHEEALAAYGQALARGAHAPEEIHLNRAVILSDELRRDGDAMAELQAALALRPDHAPALLNLGNLHEELGERDEAAACYDRLAAGAVAGPALGDAHRAQRFEALARLVHLRPPENENDPLLARLAEAAAAAGLDAPTRANLGFARARALDALGAADSAMAAFHEANRAARAGAGRHDRRRVEALVDAMIAAFPAPASAPGAIPASAPASTRAEGQGARPLFICGMFRSGSTLIEQALAGHPLVTAGGELEFLRRTAGRRLKPFPASMRSVGAQTLAALARDYLDHLALLFPHAPQGGYVTDKRPDNFLLIGLIKALFPDAKIVHTARAPLDNCLSVYFQHLNPRMMSYSTDLGDIGHYYGQYRRLIAHWKNLYRDDIFDFDYDAFVAAPRPALEELLAFCGLDWREECLAFHERPSTVKTASYWQVRRPLYRDASGRWRRYEAHLGPLRRTLGEAGVF